MTQKHTPGPWEVANSGGRVIRAGMVHPTTIAVLETVPLKISDEIVANARLIATAPDLLAAGMDIVHAHDLNMGRKAVQLRVELLRTALARASPQAW